MPITRFLLLINYNDVNCDDNGLDDKHYTKVNESLWAKTKSGNRTRVIGCLNCNV